jgi:hypothetical protein
MQGQAVLLYPRRDRTECCLRWWRRLAHDDEVVGVRPHFVASLLHFLVQWAQVSLPACNKSSASWLASRIPLRSDIQRFQGKNMNQNLHYRPLSQTVVSPMGCHLLEAFNPPAVDADSAALLVMTDLTRVAPATINADATLD